MEIADLHHFPDGHPPSPYRRPLLVVRVGSGMPPDGLTLRAVGWLERPGFPTGAVSKDFIDALVTALQNGIFSDGSRGVHSCTLCDKTMPEVRWRRRKLSLKGHGHYLVRSGKCVYMAPSLLLHYILDHKYRPPEEFIQAVIHGRFLTEDDLMIRWRVGSEAE